MASDIIGKLRAAHKVNSLRGENDLDWIDEAADEIGRLRKKVEEFRPQTAKALIDAVKAERERDAAQAENTRLRAALANSDQPCAYCSLSKEDWAKCQRGFPGCARSDDAMVADEFAADAAEGSCTHGTAKQIAAGVRQLAQEGR